MRRLPMMDGRRPQIRPEEADVGRTWTNGTAQRSVLVAPNVSVRAKQAVYGAGKATWQATGENASVAGSETGWVAIATVRSFRVCDHCEMAISTCTYETLRLLVEEWHSFAANHSQERCLAHVVAAMLTPAVTAWLPSTWQGEYTAARARAWIAERDDEGTTLLVIDKGSQHPVGCVIVAEDESSPDDGCNLRLGYLLAEGAWGKGMATELVRGFVAWCRAQGSVVSISGGVAMNNPASARVLEKNGFMPVGAISDTEQMYRIELL